MKKLDNFSNCLAILKDAIRDSFLPAFASLEETLKNKLNEVEEDWN